MSKNKAMEAVNQFICIMMDYMRETKKPNDSKENVNEDAEKHKVAEMKSILTPDNKIRFGSATAYRSNGISGMMLNVIPYENFDRVYIKLELKLAQLE